MSAATLTDAEQLRHDRIVRRVARLHAIQRRIQRQRLGILHLRGEWR